MLSDWEREYPGRVEILAKSLKDVSPSHLLDPELFDFKNLSRHTQPDGSEEEFSGELF